MEAISTALSDIYQSIKRSSLIRMLAWQDIRQRYRRSSLGPFWLTISMGVMIATIGFVFGQILKSPMEEFLPFLAIGIILWSFISSVVSEGCMGFVASESLIKQLPIPLFVHISRIIWRNILILCHNVIIIPSIFIFFDKSVSIIILLSIPGFLILVANLSWAALILGIVCTRYRDLPQIVASTLQVAFYLTPIIWMPNLLPQRAGQYLLELNPLYHLLEIIRSPLLGQTPSPQNWSVSIIFALVGWLLAITTYGHYKRRMPYWL